MKKLISLVLLVLLSIGICAQDRIAKGRVFAHNSHAALVGIEVRVFDTTIYTLTDEAGFFSIEVPDQRQKLIISAEGYDPKLVSLRPGFQQRSIKVYLLPLIEAKSLAKEKLERDSAFIDYKSAFSLSVFEIAAVAIAVRYERFLAKRHSIGIHVSPYIYGHSYFGEFSIRNIGPHKISSKYMGFKAAPFYRFYAYRENTFGVFIDAKIPFGYFDFYELEYQYNSHSHTALHISHSFWTYGVAVSAGLMFALPKTKHGFGNISIGYQYFPVVKGPEYITGSLDHNQNPLNYYSNYEWWYMPGPGSYFEFKFTMGGIY